MNEEFQIQFFALIQDDHFLQVHIDFGVIKTSLN